MKYAAAGTPVGLLLRREGRGALLQVENRGETIPAEKLPHLFDRFYRVDESRTGGEGFGLGLAIAQSDCAGPRRQHRLHQCRGHNAVYCDAAPAEK